MVFPLAVLWCQKLTCCDSVYTLEPGHYCCSWCCSCSCLLANMSFNTRSLSLAAFNLCSISFNSACCDSTDLSLFVIQQSQRSLDRFAELSARAFTCPVQLLASTQSSRCHSHPRPCDDVQQQLAWPEEAHDTARVSGVAHNELGPLAGRSPLQFNSHARPRVQLARYAVEVYQRACVQLEHAACLSTCTARNAHRGVAERYKRPKDYRVSHEHVRQEGYSAHSCECPKCCCSNSRR